MRKNHKDTYSTHQVPSYRCHALCKYIEQFEGGSVTVKEFGEMLGMNSEEIKYTRIKMHLEDIKTMKLINFQ